MGSCGGWLAVVCCAFPNRLITKLWLNGIYRPYVCQNIGFCHEVLGMSPVDFWGAFAVDCCGGTCEESKYGKLNCGSYPGVGPTDWGELPGIGFCLVRQHLHPQLQPAGVVRDLLLVSPYLVVEGHARSPCLTSTNGKQNTALV